MKYLNFFRKEVPEMLAGLSEEMKPTFGLMTPQHMVEHLIWVTKSSIKDMGPAPAELSKRELGFKKFINSGANFEYRPSDKTEKDLPALKYESLEEAISKVGEAIDRLENGIKEKSDGQSFYNPMMGKLNTEEMEFFHFRHFEWHLKKQFELGK